MKNKVFYLIIIINLMFLSGCNFFSKYEKMFDDGNDKKGIEYTDKALRAIIENDDERLSELFCDKVRHESDFSEELNSLHTFLNSKILSHGEAEVVSSNYSSSNGSFDRYEITTTVPDVISEDDSTYRINVYINTIYEKDPAIEGIVYFEIIACDPEGELDRSKCYSIGDEELL